MTKITYKSSGVDIDEGNRFVDLIKPLIKSTQNKNAVGSLGGFSGAFSLDLEGINKPLLISATDGVGTKLKIAFMTGKFDTVGIDLVAMSVNDLITCGAKPLFFLDYFATSNLSAQQGAQIVKGIAEGCIEAGCVLTGGETAEMPGFYQDSEFDLAGFAVGLVDQKKYIDGQKVRSGDVLIGISSSGLHSNGFSLARKVLFDIGSFNLSDKPHGFKNNLGAELLTPTRIYVKTALEITSNFDIHAISHITGGGLIDNIPRVIPDNLSTEIDSSSFDFPPIMKLIMDTGNIDKKEMYRTFNCGIGLVLIVSKSDSESVISHLEKIGEKAFKIGEVIESKGNKRVII